MFQCNESFFSLIQPYKDCVYLSLEILQSNEFNHSHNESLKACTNVIDLNFHYVYIIGISLTNSTKLLLLNGSNVRTMIQLVVQLVIHIKMNNKDNLYYQIDQNKHWKKVYNSLERWTQPNNALALPSDYSTPISTARPNYFPNLPSSSKHLISFVSLCLRISFCNLLTRYISWWVIT